ncbi:MAG TPA: AAA family ATPase [bacterium]|nr:AAA family ATPase [bacterium]
MTDIFKKCFKNAMEEGGGSRKAAMENGSSINVEKPQGKARIRGPVGQMIAATDELTPEEIAEHEALRNDLTEIMDLHDISQAAIARSIGVSGGALSAWRSSKYTGDSKRIAEKVANYLILARERSELPQGDIKFVLTSIAKKVHEVARIAHRDGEIALVYGDAGLGKTRAVKEYYAANPDVILIEADLGYSAKVLFVELCRRLNIEPDQSLHDMLDAVVYKLKKTGRLIIVDEAEHLPYKALEMLRRVYDKAGTGILLVGMPRLLFNLRGKRGEYAQLYSRVGIAAKVEHLRESDTEALVKAAIPGTNGVWKTFHKEALGNTRRLSKLINRSQRVASINKMPITADVVEETSKLLII